jgi:hypothetical protein
MWAGRYHSIRNIFVAIHSLHSILEAKKSIIPNFPRFYDIVMLFDQQSVNKKSYILFYHRYKTKLSLSVTLNTILHQLSAALLALKSCGWVLTLPEYLGLFEAWFFTLILQTLQPSAPQNFKSLCLSSYCQMYAAIDSK